MSANRKLDCYVKITFVLNPFKFKAFLGQHYVFQTLDKCYLISCLVDVYFKNLKQDEKQMCILKFNLSSFAYFYFSCLLVDSVFSKQKKI